MGKTETCTSCVYGILDILSQRLVLQCRYNNTLPDLANAQLKQSWQVLSRLDIKPSPPVSLSISCRRFILEEWIDKHTRKAFKGLRNVIESLKDGLTVRN